MRRIISALVSSVAYLLCQPAFGQTLEPKWEHFNEELRPAALISGSLIAGFQRRGAAGADLAISAYVPAAWAGQVVCVRVWTANGRYEAQNEYTVPEIAVGGALAVAFPTAHADFLMQQSAEEIAALTSLGGCETAAEAVALTLWNSGQGPTQLLVNSFRADLVFVYIGDTPEPVQCRPVAAEIRSAYDVVCDLDLGAAPANTTLEIIRYSNRQASPSTLLSVFVPG